MPKVGWLDDDGGRLVFFKSISKRLVDLLSFFPGKKWKGRSVFYLFFWGGGGGVGGVGWREGWGVLIVG